MTKFDNYHFVIQNAVVGFKVRLHLNFSVFIAQPDSLHFVIPNAVVGSIVRLLFQVGSALCTTRIAPQVEMTEYTKRVKVLVNPIAAQTRLLIAQTRSLTAQRWLLKAHRSSPTATPTTQTSHLLTHTVWSNLQAHPPTDLVYYLHNPHLPSRFYW